MESLQEQSTTTLNRLEKKTKISFPTEIIEEILSRLPVKSILRFRSVCKPWLARFSESSFTKLHLNRATTSHRTALLISAHDYSTGKRYILSSACDGGSVSRLTKLDLTHRSDVTESQHSNGLVFSSSRNSWLWDDYVYVLNPSTHKIFQLPRQACLSTWTRARVQNRYLFGFDESRNEHKILNIRVFLSLRPVKSTKFEFMIFSMSSYSWRKIDAEPPIGFSWDDASPCRTGLSVCVNSALHLMIQGFYGILAFDLRTNTFSIISTPKGVVPHEPDTRFTWKGKTVSKCNSPFIIKINGCIGVVCHDCVVETNEMHIWILKDYENRVWVREIIVFPNPWTELYFPFPVDALNMDEIIFSTSKVSRDTVPCKLIIYSSNVSRNHVIIYNMKSGCFKTLKFTSGHQFSFSSAMRFCHICCYVESIMPL